MAKEEEIKTRSAIPASLGPQTVDYGMGKPDAISRAGATPPTSLTAPTTLASPDMGSGRIGIETLPTKGIIPQPVLSIKPKETVPSPEAQARLTHAGPLAEIPEGAGPPSELSKIAGDALGETKQTIREYLESRPGRVGATGPEQEPGLFTNVESRLGDDGFLVGGPGTPIYQTDAEAQGGTGAIPSPAGGVPSQPGQGITRQAGVPAYGGGFLGGGFSSDVGQDIDDFIASQDPSGQGSLEAGWATLQEPSYVKYGRGRQQRKEGHIEETRRDSKADIMQMLFKARADEISGIQSAKDSFNQQRESKATEARLAGESEDKVEREARKESRLDAEAYSKQFDKIYDTWTNEELKIDEDAGPEERAKAAHAQVALAAKPESIADIPSGADGWQGGGIFIKDGKKFKPSADKEGKWTLGEELEKIESEAKR